MTLAKKDIHDLNTALEKAREFRSALMIYASALREQGIFCSLCEFVDRTEEKIALLENDYWTFERDGNLFDAEYDTKDEAEQEAQARFDDECESVGGHKNGDVEFCDVVIVRFKYDAEDRKMTTEREDKVLRWKCYHGDFAEHNTVNERMI